MTIDPSFGNLLQWGGCASGVLGSLLLALKNKYSGLGFAAFLISNIFWALFAIATHTDGLLVQQAFFSITSIIGIWTWLIRPKNAAAKATSP